MFAAIVKSILLICDIQYFTDWTASTLNYFSACSKHSFLQVIKIV